jgi:hypothetical protein
MTVTCATLVLSLPASVLIFECLPAAFPAFPSKLVPVLSDKDNFKQKGFLL